MATVLGMDDSTFGVSAFVQSLRRNGYEVIEAADRATALAIISDTPIDAVLLNCQQDLENADFVGALRSVQPHIAVVMFSGYCGVPCRRLALADACIEKGNPGLLMILRAVLCQRRYGLCRTIAA